MYIFFWLFLFGGITGCILAGLVSPQKSGRSILMKRFLAGLGGAVVFGGTILNLGLSWETVMWLLATMVLLAISLIDVEKRIISDKLLILLAGNRLFFLFLFQVPVLQKLPSILKGIFIIPGAILLLTLIMDRIMGKETMGGGDIKLMFVLGLYLDWGQMFLMVLISCIFGLMWIFGKRCLGKGMWGTDGDGSIPFGPFLSVGCVTAMWFGHPIFRWYAGLF